MSHHAFGTCSAPWLRVQHHMWLRRYRCRSRLVVVQDALQDWRALQPAAAVNVAAWAVGLRDGTSDSLHAADLAALTLQQQSHFQQQGQSSSPTPCQGCTFLSVGRHGCAQAGSHTGKVKQRLPFDHQRAHPVCKGFRGQALISAPPGDRKPDSSSSGSLASGHESQAASQPVL